MLAACAGFTVVAVAAGQLEVPRGWTVWGALIVTGVFAAALAFLVQTWAQRRLSSATRTALAFALEPVWAALFGFWLAGDRLGAIAWTGCVLIMAGIVRRRADRGRDAQAPGSSQSPSFCLRTPSTHSSPPRRRSLTRSQWSALRLRPPSLREAGAEGEVDGAGHLLREQDVARARP